MGLDFYFGLQIAECGIENSKSTTRNLKFVSNLSPNSLSVSWLPLHQPSWPLDRSPLHNLSLRSQYLHNLRAHHSLPFRAHVPVDFRCLRHRLHRSSPHRLVSTVLTQKDFHVLHSPGTEPYLRVCRRKDLPGDGYVFPP